MSNLPCIRQSLRVHRRPLRIIWRSSSSVVKLGFVANEKSSQIPLNIPNFKALIAPSYGFFDKTGYITQLHRGSESKLLCRPRRFGKTLIVSMLSYFHGLQHRDLYNTLFKSLHVNADVEKGLVVPGQYLVLHYDFSTIPHASGASSLARLIRADIRMGLMLFIREYSQYLGDDFSKNINEILDDPIQGVRLLAFEVHSVLEAVQKSGCKTHPLWGVRGIYLLVDEYDACANQYMDPHDPIPWSDNTASRLLKGFWANVKASKSLEFGIRRVYATGITPLLLSNFTSGANDHQNISFQPGVSAICGLTADEVLSALRFICDNEEEVQRHFRILQHYGNGYHFCRGARVEPVFNTHTALVYLEATKANMIANPEELWSSEVPVPFLEACIHSPAAVDDMQLALGKDRSGKWKQIPCDSLLHSITLNQLNLQATDKENRSSWQSLMVYLGGLTPAADSPSKHLRIPNLLAAQRIGEAVLTGSGLVHSIKGAIHRLGTTGNPMDVLAGYCRLIRERDLNRDALFKTEEAHRDSIRIAILENPAIQSAIEYKVKKSTHRQGFADLVVKHRNVYVLIEFKNFAVPYLRIDGSTLEEKAQNLACMQLDEILDLETDSKYHSGTIRTSLEGKDSVQLQSYIKGSTVQQEIKGKNFRGWLAAIVGSRHIIIREMKHDGTWVSDRFELVV